MKAADWADVSVDKLDDFGVGETVGLKDVRKGNSMADKMEISVVFWMAGLTVQSTAVMLIEDLVSGLAEWMAVR